MSITINMEPRKEEELRERAARRGRDADGYALELLDRLLDEPEPLEMGESDASTQTLAELFAGRTGKINSRNQADSTVSETADVDLVEQSQQTLAEALVGHVGTQHSGRGYLSQNTGKEFTRLLIEKRNAARL